jgi:glucokinase
MKNKYAIGIDIGGTETKFGIIKYKDKTNFVLEHWWSIKTFCGQKNVEHMLDTIVNQVKRIKKLKSIKFDVCGVAVAALLDFYNGDIIYAPNLMWEKFELKNLLEKKLGLPVVVDNDANLATLGIFYDKIKSEYPKVQNIICFTLGTGIGGGVVYQGELLHGGTFSAAELGHITVEPEGDFCGCGNKGCLERHIGARWFIENIIKELKNKKVKTILYKLVNNKLNNLTTKNLYVAAEKNDKYSLDKWKLYGKYLGIAISDLINIFAPEIVVFTGGVANAYKFFLPYTINEVKNRVWPVIKNVQHPLLQNIKYEVVAGQHYGVTGAGILAIKTFLL